VVEKRGTIPVLSNVKLDANGDSLHLSATDMDIAVIDQAPASVSELGATTVPAHMFYEIIRKLPDGSQVEISIGSGETKATVQSGQSTFSLACLPVDDFPTLSEDAMDHEFTLAAEQCNSLFGKTRFAISTEETRYYLNGIFLHEVKQEQGEQLRAVATDGHRLARSEIALPSGASGMPGIIIPRKTINELLKLIEEEVAEIKVAVSTSKIRFVCGNAVLVSKLIDGSFPDYERVIPAANDKSMQIDGKLFSQAVDRVSVVSMDKTRGVKLALEPGRLIISANSPEHGNASEELDVNYDADGMETGFNARYLLEMMSQIDGDTVQFLLSDAASPALVRDSAEPGALYVVMPMRV
jgi:DNA polymerase-3 subunit beta